MVSKKKIKRPLLFTVFFVLVTFTLPITLYAGPAPKCPCFTAGEIVRMISKSPFDPICVYSTEAIQTDPNGMQWDEGTAQIAQIAVVGESSSVVYSIGGYITTRFGHDTAFPACGTMEVSGVVTESKATLDLQELGLQTNGLTGVDERHVMTETQQACYDEIQKAVTQAGVTCSQVTHWVVMCDVEFAAECPW